MQKSEHFQKESFIKGMFRQKLFWTLHLREKTAFIYLKNEMIVTLIEHEFPFEENNTYPNSLFKNILWWIVSVSMLKTLSTESPSKPFLKMLRSN